MTQTTPALLPHDIAELVIANHTMTAVRELAAQRRWTTWQALELISRWRREQAHISPHSPSPTANNDMGSIVGSAGKASF